MPATAPSMVPCWIAGSDIAERHRDRRGAEPLERRHLELGGEDADLLAFEVGEMADRRLGDHRGRRIMNMRDAVQALVGAEAEHQLEHRRIGGDALALRQRADQARRRHHLEALIDADEEFRRQDRALDRAELRAFDLPRDRAELARRIDLRP